MVLFCQPDSKPYDDGDDDGQGEHENQAYPSPATSLSNVLVIPHIIETFPVRTYDIAQGVFWRPVIKAVTRRIPKRPPATESPATVMVSFLRLWRRGYTIFFNDRESIFRNRARATAVLRSIGGMSYGHGGIVCSSADGGSFSSCRVVCDSCQQRACSNRS